MSQAHIEQFYAKASKDQALIAKMMEGTKGPDDFVANAVKEGKTLGYNFSAEEANAWIKKQQQIKASGELSDSQLEAVAGGKGSVSSVVSTVGGGIQTGWNAYVGGVNQVGHAIGGGLQQAANWFSSW